MTERTGHLLSHKKKHLSRHDWFHIRSTRYTPISAKDSMTSLVEQSGWLSSTTESNFILVIWSTSIRLLLFFNRKSFSEWLSNFLPLKLTLKIYFSYNFWLFMIKLLLVKSTVFPKIVIQVAVLQCFPKVLSC